MGSISYAHIKMPCFGTSDPGKILASEFLGLRTQTRAKFKSSLISDFNSLFKTCEKGALFYLRTSLPGNGKPLDTVNSGSISE